ncbi:MAG: Protein export cytoplasm protein SecA ATPase helicase, partial [Myxococcaceae bacterium]|nr:Protein export cytoplasm protein SecA ATPase helicase [Myxococcaceae bacterium]
RAADSDALRAQLPDATALRRHHAVVLAARLPGLSLPDEILDEPADEPAASAAARGWCMAKHPEALARLLAASLTTDPPRSLEQLFRAIALLNSRTASALLRGAFERVLALGATDPLMQTIEALGDPALLPDVLGAWRPGERVIARTAALLAALGGGAYALPAAVRAEADAQAALIAKTKVPRRDQMALFEAMMAEPLRLQLRCRACGRASHHLAGRATLHPDREECLRDGWDGVCFERIFVCKYCGAEDDYALTKPAHTQLMAEALLSFQPGSQEEMIEHGPRVAIGVPGLSDGTHIRRASDAVAYWQRRVEARPGDGEAWLRLGNMLKKNGRAEQSIEAYGRAIAARPDDLDALGQKLELLLQRGREDEAGALPRLILPLLAKPGVEPWFREGVAYSVARVLASAAAKGQSLGLHAGWTKRGPGGVEVREMGEVDLRRVKDFKRLEAFLAHPSVEALALSEASPTAHDAELEALLNARAPLATMLRDKYDLAPTPSPVVRAEPKVGRNDPCPCGSGKKYKKCHG